MKSNNNHFFSSAANQIIAIFVMSGQLYLPALAQDDSFSAPVPGSPVNSVVESSKNAEIAASQSLPISGLNSADNSLTNFALNDLPISIKGLNIWLSKYKQEAKEDQISEEKLNPLIIWVDGLIKAHSRLANAFARNDSLKTDYENESNLLKQLRQIKNEFLYLKAQILIKGKKLKQAIPILIEITCTEPNSALGHTAYEHLKHSGFSLSAQTTQPGLSLQDPAVKNKQSAATNN